MHEAVSVVIPGAKNKDHVDLNTASSEVNEISSLMNKINQIYTKYLELLKKRDIKRYK